jgi:hypothetical protein
MKNQSMLCTAILIRTDKTADCSARKLAGCYDHVDLIQ